MSLFKSQASTLQPSPALLGHHLSRLLKLETWRHPGFLPLPHHSHVIIRHQVLSFLLAKQSLNWPTSPLHMHYLVSIHLFSPAPLVEPAHRIPVPPTPFALRARSVFYTSSQDDVLKSGIGSCDPRALFNLSCCSIPYLAKSKLSTPAPEVRHGSGPAFVTFCLISTLFLAHFVSTTLASL